MQDEKEKLLKTLAERIAEEQQKKQGWEQTTLSGGLPGICLLLGKLMELYPGEERFVELARGCLGQCVSYLNEHGTFSSSMFSGLAGMGLGAYCVSNGGRDYQKLIKTITGGVIEGVEKGIAEICQGSGTHCLFYDTMEGISGMLSYLTLFAEDEKVRAILEKGAQALIFLTREITVLGYQVPGWHLPAEKNYGMVLLYEYFEKNHRFPSMEQMAKMVGMPGTKYKKWNLYRLKMRIRNKLSH